ncbi:MAG TPA: glycosyltransferase [Caulobacteraceae bacterium]
MRIVYFTHSLQSDWNHGNAHFLRGVLRELIAMGHEVKAYEPGAAWSLQNLLADHGERGLEPYRATYPELSSYVFGKDFDLADAVEGADLVVVHEWNEPALVKAIGKLRRDGGRFTLLFHDTHHRAVSDPEAIRTFDLSNYDGVLAFGETLAEVYRHWGWGERVWVWHEAADIRLFHPPHLEGPREGLVWIGNWGDGERTKEIETYLLKPARKAHLGLDIHGVRYPDKALKMLDKHAARYLGWVANAEAPKVFAGHVATVHVPRRFYVEMLPGIPTIRVFEALACGIPLLSAPWSDSENLFRVGQDFLMVDSGKAMAKAMKAMRDDADLRHSLVESGLETIRARHTCAHRAQELIAVVETLRAFPPISSPHAEPFEARGRAKNAELQETAA